MSLSGAVLHPADPDRLSETLRVLAGEIGPRLAGSRADERVTEFITEELRRSGAAVSVERYPMNERHVEEEHLEVLLDGTWQTFPCSLFSNTPGTNGEPLEAPLVFFESPSEYERPSLEHLRGKAVLHLGSHIESREAYRRLIEAGPAMLLFVDVRYPGEVPLADGMFPAYTRAIGAVPTLNVAYMHAWNWWTRGATKARVRVIGGMRRSSSANVIAELLPAIGVDGAARPIYITAHHDSQADSAGADDNGSGVAAVIELARLLGERGMFRRPVHFISFGTEEQLSVGSSEYVRRHRSELGEHGGFVFNIDSVGSPMGWFELCASGPSSMTRFVQENLSEGGVYARVNEGVMPYADHFPFAAAGIPGVTVLRHNCTSGRFFHHRPDDDLSRVSAALLAKLVDAVAQCAVAYADGPPAPFSGSIPEGQRGEIRSCWEDLFGGWDAEP